MAIVPNLATHAGPFATRGLSSFLHVAQVFVACTLPDAESCPSQQHLEYVDVIYFVGAHLVADTRGGHTSL